MQKNSLTQAIKLSISLIRIPRLFFSILLFPIAISLIIVFAQVVVTGLFIRSSTQSMSERTTKLSEANNKSLVRELIYGSSSLRPSLAVCRWLPPSDSNPYETPPNGCEPDRLDAALHVRDPETFDPSAYQTLLSGNFDRLHICKKDCTPDIVISPKGKDVESAVGSSVALLLMQLTFYNSSVQEHMMEASSVFDDTMAKFGTIELSLPGFSQPVPFTGLKQRLMVLLNVAMLIIIALYLALKAHRNVLDYFARNGALLPMVAAAGSDTFYMSIWLITLFRVAIFLMAAFPLLVFAAIDSGSTKYFSALVSDSAFFLFWVLVLTLGVFLTTLISSIAELKRRHSFITALYRYVPLLISFAGAVIWLATLLFDTEVFLTLRSITTSIPLIGLTPLLLAPLFRPAAWPMIAHGISSFILIALLLKTNARWFSAHVEEL
jgi:hypothetical protein